MAPHANPSSDQQVMTDHHENISHSETSSTTVADANKEKSDRPVNHAHFGENQEKTISNDEWSDEDKARGWREITEDECRSDLGFGFPTMKKW